jgi:hypothetical protein
VAHGSLAETRWGRCALLTESAATTELTLDWTWCPDVRIATGPGTRASWPGRSMPTGA